MPDFLQDSNLALGFVLWGDGDPSQSTFLGKPLYDLDGNIVTSLEATSEFDLSMDPSANLIDNLVLIDQLAARNEILFNLCFACPAVKSAIRLTWTINVDVQDRQCLKVQGNMVDFGR